MVFWISLRRLCWLILNDSLRKCPNVLFPVLQAIFKILQKGSKQPSQWHKDIRHFHVFKKFKSKCRVKRIHSSPHPYLEKLGQGKWIILLCQTVGQVQNGRWTSMNSEIFCTLKWVLSKNICEKGA